MTANGAASIRARLKQHTDTSKQDFNLTLTRYGLERLLYRLSISEHAANFLLDGALLFQLWYGQPHRPTRDADLLGFGPDDVPTLVSVFRSLCGIAVDDGNAVTVLGMTNTRMKDFFDLELLLRDTALDDAQLQRVVEATFARRQTAMPSTTPSGLSDAFADDATKQMQWRAFLKKNKLEPMDLDEVVKTIRERVLQLGFLHT